MQEIVQSIVQQAGVSEEQAKTAFVATLTAIKTKLPDSVASQLDGLLTGTEFDYKVVINEKVHELRDDAAEKFQELKGEATEKFEELREEFKKIF